MMSLIVERHGINAMSLDDRTGLPADLVVNSGPGVWDIGVGVTIVPCHSLLTFRLHSQAVIRFNSAFVCSALKAHPTATISRETRLASIMRDKANGWT
jgi:hypothetical protein